MRSREGVPAHLADENGPDLRHALGKKILIVEDSPSARSLLQALLLRLGVGLPDLRLAGSVPEALQVFTSWQPDIVIVDIELRGGPAPSLGRAADGTPREYAKNGAELAVQLLQRDPDLKVIVSSASEPDATVLGPLVKDGRVLSMMKPLLASKVAEYLAKATAPSSRAPARS